MAMFVDEEDSLCRASHAEVFVVVLKALQAGRDGGVCWSERRAEVKVS